MPITKSAKKALRQNIRRRARNIRRKELLKKTLKKFKGFASAKKTKEAKEFLPEVYEILDKAAKWGIIKKNAASRKKSRLARMLNK
ncbi:MAG: 30S ribosomal protein S20 [bacterium]|nr:30S ribosomal protein S20 [bacterium]